MKVPKGYIWKFHVEKTKMFSKTVEIKCQAGTYLATSVKFFQRYEDVRDGGRSFRNLRVIGTTWYAIFDNCDEHQSNENEDHRNFIQLFLGVVPGGALACEFICTFGERRQRTAFATLLQNPNTTRLEFTDFLRYYRSRLYFWIIHSCTLRSRSNMKTQSMLMGLMLKSRGATRSCRDVLAAFGILPAHTSFVNWRDALVETIGDDIK